MDDPERCLERPAAGVEDAIGFGVTDRAVAERG
jgi:hypothetical protein